MPFIQDLGNSVLNAAASRVSKRIGKIARTRKFIANGRGFLAETKSRLREFSRRQEAIRTEYADIGLERVIGDKNDILSIEFLEAGLLAAKSIGRINVMFGTEYGSGFHVGNKIIM